MRTLALLAFSALVSLAIGQVKKPLDHDVYDSWRSLRSWSFNDQGSWVAYNVGPAVGDSELTVMRVGGAGAPTVIPRGGTARFSRDGMFVLTICPPAKAEVDKAKKDKKKPNEMPKSSLVVVDLKSGAQVDTPRVTSFSMAADGGDWIAYKQEALTPASPATPPKPEEKKPEEDKSKPQKKRDHAVGQELTLRRLSTGEERKLADVTDFQFSKDGDQFVYVVSGKSGDSDGVYCFNTDSQVPVNVIQGLGTYRSVDVHEKSNAIAFVSDKNDYKAEKPALELYVYTVQGGAKLVAKNGQPGMPADWILSASGVSFSDNGKRVFCSTVPKPVEEKKDETPDDEKPMLDVWSWTDPELQPMQLLRANQVRNKVYEAYVDLATGKFTQLETMAVPNVTVGARGDATHAIGSNNQAYRQLVSWDDEYSDVFIVDVATGSAKRIISQTSGIPSAGPDGKVAVWYDDRARQFRSVDLTTGILRDLTAGIPYPIYDEEDDHPAPPPPHGLGGWTEDGSGVLVYDKYDIWLCDPRGAKLARALTGGYGRSSRQTLRIAYREPDSRGVDLSQPLYLSFFHRVSRDAGFMRLNGDKLENLISGPKTFASLNRAKAGKTWGYVRSDFNESPRLYLTEGSLLDAQPVTEVNPQQKEYNWCSVELVSWTSLDGKPVEGLLYKPEDFDAGKKYPMITYFYERDSDNLHRYIPPTPSASTINPTWFASRGYIVFIPDIPYEVGYPGPSAVKAILPGVTSIVSRGYVDPKRIGCQGQSWGGYQTAYLITQSHIFACAGAGAAVSNMISAYGGVRWGSGMVRQFQYEKGQSRIGGTPWEMPFRYIENSPIFWVDRIKTPLLMMNNDQDDAVPWYQGIELFTAMRRLQKPVWMLVYNNEGHNLMRRPNRKDLSVRLQQFFDHYLMGAPAPKWMTEGVPAVRKGKG